MIWQPNPFTIPLLLIAAFLAGMAVFAWWRRPAVGAGPTALLLAAVAWWALTYALEFASQDLASKLVWSRASYIGIVLVPVSWLAMTWQLARRGPLRPLLVGLLLVIPLVVLMGVYTNDLHSFVWSYLQLQDRGSFMILEVGHGWLFWVYWVYVVVVLVGGALLLVKPFRSGGEQLRRQIALLWAAASIPWIGNLLYVSGLNPWPALDLTVFAFAISAMLAAGAILRYGFLDIWPYARDLVVASMEDAVLVANLDAGIVQANPAAGTLLGMDPNEMVGRPASAIIPSTLREALNTDAAVSVPVASAAPTAESRWIEARRSPVRDHSQHEIGSLFLMRDVTRQREAELAHQSDQARRIAEMQALFETSLAINGQESLAKLLPAIVERAATLLNTRCGSLFMVRPDQQSIEMVVVHNLSESYVGSVLPFGEGISGRVALTQKTMQVPDYRAWEDRAALFSEDPFRRVLAVPLHIGDRVLGVLNVIDDEKTGAFDDHEIRLVELLAEQAAVAIEKTRLLEAEQEQRRLAVALRDTALALTSSLDLNQFLDLLLQEIKRVVPYDVGNVMLVENGMARVVRTRGAERHGQASASDVLAVRLNVQTTPNLRQMAATHRPLIISDVAADPDWVNIPKAERIRSWAGAPILVNGETVAFCSLDHDQAGFYQEEHAARLAAFASQAGAAMANVRLYRDLSEALKAREKLIKSVSHELRTPLANVLGYAELLHDHVVADDARIQQGLNVIIQQATRLKYLVNQLISFQEFDSQSLHMDAIAIAPWLETQSPTWLPLLDRKHQVLEMNIRPDVGSVHGDPRYLNQVIYHLLQNASQFSADGAHIKLDSWPMETQDGPAVAIAVRDQGIGIPADHLPRVFGRFYQVADSEGPSSGGLGLGLAIAQEIIALHGGRIWAESPGRNLGATFVFTLPRLQPDPG